VQEKPKVRRRMDAAENYEAPNALVALGSRACGVALGSHMEG
jgi:hypothetical protein